MILRNHTVRRCFISLVLAFLFFPAMVGAQTTTSPAREKTLQLGKVTWYTEQNDFADIIGIAQKENKPILVFFTATWCGPCQGLKKNVLIKDEFQRVADKALLLYIEQTDRKGQEYVAKYKIDRFPTFLLFSPAGERLLTGDIGRSQSELENVVGLAQSGRLEKQGKMRRIGAVDWYTVETPFADLLQKAKKEDKLILVYLAVGPAQFPDFLPQPEESSLLDPRFKQVAEQVILYTLNPGDGDFKSILPDSTDTETSSFSGYSYPGFLIYAADGQLLEPSSPQPPNEIKTIEDWLEWIKEVKAGNSYFGLKQQVKSAPENRELLGQWIEKIPLFYEKERTEALKKFIDLNPDTNDPRTQESYEDLIWDLSLYIRAEADFDKNEIRRLAEENQPYFDALMKAYFPDRFAYTLKESRNQLTIVSFLNDLGRYGEACSCFEKLLNQANSRSREVLDDFNFSEVLWAYLKSGQEEKAESWLDRLEKSVAQAKTTEEKEQMGFLLSTFYEPFIRFYGEKGERGRARDYLQKVIELNKHNNREMENEDLKIRYAWEFGLFAEELIAKAKEELKTADGRAIWDLTGNIAEWTAALGDKPEARRIIGEALTDRRILDAYAEKGKRTLLMKAAQTLTLSKAADEQTLEYAQEAVRLKEDTNSLMILADVYAALGRFDEAIQCGGKIINSSPDRRLSAFIQKKIERWKRERSSGINKN